MTDLAAAENTAENTVRRTSEIDSPVIEDGEEMAMKVKGLLDVIQTRIREASAELDGYKDPESAEDTKKLLASYWEQVVDEGELDEALKVHEELTNDVNHLHRILIAKELDLEKAADLFFEQVPWRAKWKPHDVDPATITNAMSSGFYRLCGYAKNGCICANFKLGRWDPYSWGESDEEAKDEFTRFVSYMIEQKISKMQPKPVPQKWTVIMDLDGFYSSMAFQSRFRENIRNLIYMGQVQYPERIHKVMIVNAPYLFSTVWTLIKALLDARTAAAVSFVYVDDLKQEIDLSTLTQEYGGEHEEYPVPSATLGEER